MEDGDGSKSRGIPCMPSQERRPFPKPMVVEARRGLGLGLTYNHGSSQTAQIDPETNT